MNKINRLVIFINHDFAIRKTIKHTFKPCAVFLFTLHQRLLRPLALGDVSDKVNRSHNIAFLIEYRRCHQFKMNPQVRFKKFHPSRLFGFKRFFMRAIRHRLVCPVNYFIAVSADNLLRFHLNDISKSLIHPGKPEIFITNRN